jgi:hypothetical protein
VLVDDVPQSEIEQSCTVDSCSMTHEWSFAPAAFAPGRHEVVVKAQDRLDHESRRSFVVDVPADPGCAGGTFDVRDVLAPATVDSACPGATDKDVYAEARLRFDAPSADLAGTDLANVGDVNGDGRPDIAVAAPGATSNGRTRAGSVYVVFGRATPPDPSSWGTVATMVSLPSLGSQGFRIDGPAASQNLRAVAGIGDVNGDGRADLAVGNSSASNNGRAASGSAYVVFGKSGTASVDLAALGPGGYRIDGAGAGDGAGYTVAGIGDLNSDGRAELAVAARSTDFNSRPDAGSVYVVYGKPTTAGIDLAALGTAGYRIDGPGRTESGTGVGESLTATSDVNGDGRADIVIGAPLASKNGRAASGSVYGTSTPMNVDLASLGSAGYRIDGAKAEDKLPEAVTGLGDLDGDGLAEIALGAPTADNRHLDGGSVYVVFGKSRTGSLDLRTLDGDGYRIDGGDGEGIGVRLAGLADVNGDGIRDLAIGNRAGTPLDRGGAYVSFGRQTAGTVDMTVRPLTGYRIAGAHDPLPVDGGDFLADGGATLALTDANGGAADIWLLDARHRVG